MFHINDPSNDVEAQMMLLSKISVSFRHNLEDLDLSKFMFDLHSKRRQFLVVLFLLLGEALSFLSLERKSHVGRCFL